MPINRLILIIDEQSIVQVCVIIDCHRLASIVIDCRYQSINWHRLSSIININRLICIDFLPIFIYWLLLLIGFIFSQDFKRHSLLMHFVITKTYCFFLLQVSTWFQNHRRLERAKSYTPGQYALTEATD